MTIIVERVKVRKIMANSLYRITEDFEKELCKYTNAPFAVAVDNCSNAIFMALMYEKVKGMEISIPNRTYMSVPCSIIHAGAKIKFLEVEGNKLKGAYQLYPTKIWDAALSFTADMYKPNTHTCISFTGPNKILKLSKGGAILTDDEKAYEWFKRARFSGRRPISYHEDNFDMIGWNFYMLPELAARGLLLMNQFYNLDGTKKHNPDIELPYPDLSKYKVYTQPHE